jgi:D-hexose-6-phosphate mutarotase
MWAETVQGKPSRYASHGEELAGDLPATLELMQQLHTESMAIFAALTDEQLARKCITPGGGEIAAWKWLRAMVEHEVHHRGQIYMYLGILGVATPPIFGLTSEEVRARSISDLPATEAPLAYPGPKAAPQSAFVISRPGISDGAIELQSMPQTNSTAAELNRSHGIVGAAQVIPDDAGNPAVRITTPNCDAKIHLHGAQVTSWKPAGAEEVIFLSSRARWAEGQAIRGGIPICFPWFRAKADDPHAPAHGFVRTNIWALESIEQHAGDITVSMYTRNDASTQKWWPSEFRLLHRVTFGTDLKLELTVTNTGSSAFRFEEALHTYHAVGDVQKAGIRGLDGASYLDNTDSNREKKQAGDVPITSPTDNAYVNTQNALELLDAVLHRRIHIAKQNSRTTVIWNPWAEAAGKMSDLGSGEWRKMLCAEAANILTDAVGLAPGESHTMTVTMTVGPL